MPGIRAVPVNTKRVHNSAHKAQGVGRVEAVRNRKGVEYATDVFQPKSRHAVIQIDTYTILWYLDRPKKQRRGNARIVRMRAQRARCNAVDSYEREGALVSPLIRSDKRALHESRVRVELIRGLTTGIGVCRGTAESEVGLAHKPVEVRDRRGIAAFGVSAGAICRHD